MSESNTLPSRLNAAIRARRMTRRQASDSIGCQPNTLYSWLGGYTKPKSGIVRDHVERWIAESPVA